MTGGQAADGTVIGAGRWSPCDHGSAFTWIVGLGDVLRHIQNRRRLVVVDGDVEGRGALVAVEIGGGVSDGGRPDGEGHPGSMIGSQGGEIGGSIAVIGGARLGPCDHGTAGAIIVG